jgi:hypothetical protein
MVSRPAHTLVDFLHRLADSRGRCAATDPELLARFVRHRDTTAFESLLWRHGAMVWGVCRRVLRDTHHAEDAFQATFLVLARKADGIDCRTALPGWLYRVAYRIALRARQEVARRASLQQPLVDVPAATGCPPLIEQDWRPILDEELRQLPEKYRCRWSYATSRGGPLRRRPRRWGVRVAPSRCACGERGSGCGSGCRAAAWGCRPCWRGWQLAEWSSRWPW